MTQVSKVEGIKELDKEIKCLHKLSEILRVSLSHQLLYLVRNLEVHDEHSSDTKWNKIHQVDIAKVARLHAVYLTCLSFIESLPKIKLDKKTVDVMTDVCKVFLTQMVIKFGETALMHGYINSEQMIGIQTYHDELVSSLKPHCMALIECQIIHEAMNQGTALSDFSDDYATKLYERAAFSPLNHHEKLETIDTDLKPLSAKLTNFAKL